MAERNQALYKCQINSIRVEHNLWKTGDFIMPTVSIGKILEWNVPINYHLNSWNRKRQIAYIVYRRSYRISLISDMHTKQ